MDETSKPLDPPSHAIAGLRSLRGDVTNVIATQDELQARLDDLEAMTATLARQWMMTVAGLLAITLAYKGLAKQLELTTACAREASTAVRSAP